MSAALRAELIKLRTTRTFLALVGSSVALSLLIVVLITLIDSDFKEEHLRATFAADFSSLFILMLGVIGMAGEWRHRTIAGSVLSIPHRLRLMLAKVLSYAIAGVVLSLVVSVVIMVVGSSIISIRGEETLAFADLLDVLWRSLVVAGAYGAIGVCAGALLRNPAGAIVLLLALLFVFDTTLLAVAPDVWKWGPLGGAPAAITTLTPDDDIDLLSPALGVLILFGWIAALFAAAAATFKRRDLV